MAQKIEDDAIASAITDLLKKNEMTVRQLADDIMVPEQTLYAMIRRQTTRADLDVLYSIADHFGEEITIFLGSKASRKKRLSPVQEKILDMTDVLNDAGNDKVLTYAVDISLKYSKQTQAHSKSKSKTE